MCKNNIELENSIACGKVIVTTFSPPRQASAHFIKKSVSGTYGSGGVSCMLFSFHGFVYHTSRYLSIQRHLSPSSAIPDKFVKSSNGMSAWKGVWSIVIFCFP